MQGSRHYLHDGRNERPRWCRELDITCMMVIMRGHAGAGNSTLLINLCESMRGHAGAGKSTLLINLSKYIEDGDALKMQSSQPNRYTALDLDAIGCEFESRQ